MKDVWTIYLQERIMQPWEGKIWEFVNSEFSRLDGILQRFGMWYGSQFSSIGHRLLGWHLSQDKIMTYGALEAGEKRLREMYERRCRLGGILGRRYGLIIN